MSDCIGIGCKAAVMLEQIEALRRQRDALAETVNAAEIASDVLVEQLAAMTAERDDYSNRCLHLTVELTDCQQERDELDKLYGLQFNENNDLVRERAANQAREQQLREEVYIRSGYSRDVLDKIFPHDDTALRQYGAKLLRDTAKSLSGIYHPTAIADLNRMADELEKKT